MGTGLPRFHAAISAVLALMAGAAPARASNHHEHLPTLLSYDDLEAGLSACGKSAEELRLARMFAKPAAALDAIFGAGAGAAMTSAEAHTLGEAATAVAGALGGGASRGDYMRGFFEFNDVNGPSPAAAEEIGFSVRPHAFDQIISCGPAAVDAAVAHYLDRVPLRDRRVISLTASKRYFRAPMSWLPAHLSRVFAAAGTESEFFVSFQRALLAPGRGRDFEEALAITKEALSSGLAHGVDIVGSLHDGTDAEGPAKPRWWRDEMGERLSAVVAAAAAVPGAQMRLHGWEAPVRGRQPDYYAVLFRVLAGAPRLPWLLRIGHMGGLRARDIARLDAIAAGGRSSLFFEACLESNRRLHGVPTRRLARTVKKLLQDGRSVALGADGEGMFGDGARFTAMLAGLAREGLDGASVTALETQAAAPCAALLK